MIPLRNTPKGWLLQVRTTPKAAREELAGIRSGALLVKVTVAPENGKANAAVIALLAKEFDIPKSALVLVNGETHRNKLFHLVSHVQQVQARLWGFQQE